MKMQNTLLANLRLGSGIILFIYIGTHLVNHSCGLASLETLNSGRDIFVTVWRSWPGTILLYGALLTHITLFFISLYIRRTFRLKPREYFQIFSGLAIPFLLVEHILGTRGLNVAFQVNDNYLYEILVLWVYAPEKGVLQMVLIAIVWLHGCIGLHFWLRLKPHYRRFAPIGLTFAIIIPAMGLGGFISSGQEIEILRKSALWMENTSQGINWPDDIAVAWVSNWKILFWKVFGGLVILTITANRFRWLINYHSHQIYLTYSDDLVVKIKSGITVLEASKLKKIQHANLCGGKGRCATCQIRLGRGLENVERPSSLEQKTLKRVNAPKNVRLACQLKPTHNLEIQLLLSPNCKPRDLHKSIYITE